MPYNGELDRTGSASIEAVRETPRPPNERRRRLSVLQTSGDRDEPVGTRDAVWMLAFFLVLVIVWCAALTPLEAILGIPLFIGGGPPAPSSLRDALWHLLTTFLLVLPTRDRRAFALAPLFSLGLDIDHIFGAYLPGPFSRMAHDLFFIGGAAAVLVVLLGRYASLLVLGGTVAHLAVDGGSFPLFAPFSVTRFGLGYPETVGLVIVAALAFFLACRPVQDFRKSWSVLWLVVAVVALALILLWVAPGFQSFTTA